MPQNTQLDARIPNNLFWPYDRITAELSEEPRLVSGENVWVTLGGKLAKRPGTTAVSNTGSALRLDRVWLYETQENPPQVYLLGSFFDSGDSRWKMYKNDRGGSSGWVSVGSTRSLANSIAPHEVVFSRGLAYIRAVPPNGDSDKYGTTIFDGSGSGAVRLWGLPAPTVPARISGVVTRLNEDVDATETAIDVVSAGSFPSTPFVIQVEYERMNVTNVTSNTLTVTRGYDGTTAVEHPDDTVVLYRDWSASDHRVDVNFAWGYTYAWKSLTGHVSNRAPVEQNPDLLPSYTGPFLDLKPKITIQGHSDTTNIPTIVVYRTQDGGGTWFKLEEVSNTGSGNITYTDDSLGTGGSSTTFNDPVPDAFLDVNEIAPSLTSNSPPPTVLAPLIVGTDNPIPGTPLASFNSRIWYALGNVLFYSAQEELNEGIPEEAFPSGLRGNFFRTQYPILNLISTDTALYVLTTKNLLVLTGNNRETFSLNVLYENLGAPFGHPRAIEAFGKNIAFLTHDYRIALIRESKESVLSFVSDPLYTDLTDQIALDTTNMECDLTYWGDLEKDWLIVSIHNKDDATESKHWVLDLKLSEKINKPFWFPPWTLPTTAMFSGRLTESQTQRRLCFFVRNGAAPYSRFIQFDPLNQTSIDTTAGTAGGSGTAGIDFFFNTHLHRVPPGNHVNELRSGALSPVVQYLLLDRTYNSGDEIPDISYYKDDLWTEPIDIDNLEEAPRRNESRGYQTIQAHINDTADRVAFRVGQINSTKIFEIQNLYPVYNPDGGA